MPDVQLDNADSILNGFSDLDDPRSHINRRYLLGVLIVISIMAVIAGDDGHTAIGTWAENKKAWLRKHLKLPNEDHHRIGGARVA